MDKGLEELIRRRRETLNARLLDAEGDVARPAPGEWPDDLGDDQILAGALLELERHIYAPEWRMEPGRQFLIEVPSGRNPPGLIMGRVELLRAVGTARDFASDGGVLLDVQMRVRTIDARFHEISEAEAIRRGMVTS